MAQIYQRGSDRFVCGTFRDKPPLAPVSELKKSLQDISDKMGMQGLCVIGNQTDEHIHAVLSNDFGFSLGECVWECLKEAGFDSEASVIWCEEIEPEAGNTVGDCLLVIIANGVVIYDVRMPPAHLDHNVERLLEHAAEQFDILVYGNTPIADPFAEEKDVADIGISKDKIASYIVSEMPYLRAVRALPRFEFVPISDAFVRAGMIKPWVKPAIFLGCFSVALIVLFYLVQNPDSPVKLPNVIIDDYKEYKAALRSPSPALMLNEIQSVQDAFKSGDGYVLQKTYVAGGQITLTLSLLNDVFITLINELKTAGWHVSLGEGVVNASRPLTTPVRPKISSIMILEDVIASLLDSAYFMGVLVDVESSRSTGDFSVTQLTIHYKEIGGDMTAYLAEALAGYPLVLESMNIKHTSSFDQEVTLVLSVWGK